MPVTASHYITMWQTSPLTSFAGQEGADNWVFHMPLSWSTMLWTGEFFLYSVAASKHTKVSENAVVCLGKK